MREKIAEGYSGWPGPGADAGRMLSTARMREDQNLRLRDQCFSRAAVRSHGFSGWTSEALALSIIFGFPVRFGFSDDLVERGSEL